MDGDLEFSPSEVTLSNIKELNIRQSVLSEQKICEMSELADAAGDFVCGLLQSGMNTYEALSVLSEGVKMDFEAVHSEALGENIARLMRSGVKDCMFDRAVFCQMLLSKMKGGGFSFSEGDFLRSESREESFVYVKNTLSDEAYDVFSQSFENPRVRYAESFKEAVKALTDGNASYCLLPIEEKGGARLPTVSELIFGNELKIVALTPVFGPDGTADVKYALLSRHFFVPDVSAEDDRYLEVRFGKNTGTLLSEVLSAAELFGIDLYRINTESYDTEEGKKTFYSSVFKTEGEDFTQLLVYLTLYSVDYTPIGIYSNLE